MWECWIILPGISGFREDSPLDDEHLVNLPDLPIPKIPENRCYILMEMMENHTKTLLTIKIRYRLATHSLNLF